MMRTGQLGRMLGPILTVGARIAGFVSPRDREGTGLFGRPRPLTRSTTAGVKRAAAKARNVKRHKAAMRRAA